MKALRSLVLPLAAALLGACATPQPQLTPARADNLTGRMVLRVNSTPGQAPEVLVAGFELTGDPKEGQLDLTSPLGTMVARARWEPSRVWLRTPDGQRTFESLDALAREMLGENLPLVALFDWLRGRPWPQAPSTPRTDEAGPGFDQLGWQVDLARFAEGVIVAQREAPPAAALRVRVDRPAP